MTRRKSDDFLVCASGTVRRFEEEETN
ncbi:hypothetical protein KGM_207921 [Danaus plexippus plexippus]|uniref:Uncharacterized protein n=1 Tax=Danaus plexippus plexippus TaxID=278856 RepID=A0A212EJV1_DANPL|nr:hypothetical protein KGM_207921 [Danaus plexippus plexippus]